MEELVEIIQSNPDSRELKRALAVQMVLKGYKYRQIAEILSVSDSFIAQMVASV
jgi:putative transposase